MFDYFLVPPGRAQQVDSSSESVGVDTPRNVRRTNKQTSKETKVPLKIYQPVPHLPTNKIRQQPTSKKQPINLYRKEVTCNQSRPIQQMKVNYNSDELKPANSEQDQFYQSLSTPSGPGSPAPQRTLAGNQVR